MTTDFRDRHTDGPPLSVARRMRAAMSAAGTQPSCPAGVRTRTHAPCRRTTASPSPLKIFDWPGPPGDPDKCVSVVAP